MASRRSTKHKSEVDEDGYFDMDEWVDEHLPTEEDVIAKEEVTDYNNIEEPATIKLQLRMDFKLKLHGPVSGKLYIWERAGAVVEVDKIDSELHDKRLGGKVCCGGNPDNNKLFVLIEE